MSRLTISEEVLSLLRCPKTRQPLHLASASELKSLEARGGSWKDALITENGAIAYPVEDGFPILLIERLTVIESG